MTVFEQFISESVFAELREEETSPDGSSHKVLFRVTDLALWSEVLLSILRFSDEEEDYIISVRKEYYMNDGKPSFTWVLIVWGNIEAAVADLGPFFTSPKKKQEPVVQEPTQNHRSVPEPVPDKKIIEARKINSEDGVRIVKRVKLAFARGNRNAPPEGTTKKFGDKSLGAYVTLASGSML